MRKNSSTDISELFTRNGLERLKQGQLLRFNKAGVITELIITKINRKSAKVYAKETKTYDMNDIVMQDEDGNLITLNEKAGGDNA